MAVRINCVQVAAPTSGAGTQDITISGFGTVKAYLVIATSATANATATDHAIFSFGASDGTSQYVATNISENAVAPGDMYRRQENDAVLEFLDGTGAISGEAAHSAFITDGVRIAWSDYPPAAYLLHFVFFGGSDLSAVVGTGTHTGAIAAEQAFTTGHQSDQIIFFTDSPTAGIEFGNTEVHQHITVGMASRDATTVQGCVNMGGLDASTNANLRVHTANNRVVQCFIFSSGATYWGLELTAWGATSFSLTKQGHANSGTFCYLSLNYGGAATYKAIHIDSPTTATSVGYTWPGFSPQFVFTILGYASTINTTLGDETTGAGVIAVSAMSETAEWTVGVSDEDLSNPADTQSLADTKAIAFARGTGATSHTATGPSGSGSFDVNGYTLAYTVADGTVRKWVAMAVEESADVGGLSIPVAMHHRRMQGVS